MQTIPCLSDFDPSSRASRHRHGNAPDKSRLSSHSWCHPLLAAYSDFPTGMNPKLNIVQPLDLAVERIHHELHLRMVLAIRIGHEVERGLFDLNTAAACV